MAKKPPLPAVMLNLTIGHWVARLTYIAAKLKLADLLKDGPRTAAHLRQPRAFTPGALPCPA
ncbi:MAG: hypothetical protein H0W28_08865 [Pyrinomonadaceae bacterium]|jgi:hypothetical protein|nr:hypothetical protein [Pyrinomonadaceae bacterium]